MKAKLVVVGGDAKTQEVNLKLPTVIGRGKGSSLIVPHALVSRKHCEIFEREGILIVRDLNSMNGTYINNYRIQGEQPLHPGELLTLGNVTFRAVYEEASSEAIPAGGSLTSDSSSGNTLSQTVRVDEGSARPLDQKTSPTPLHVNQMENSAAEVLSRSEAEPLVSARSKLDTPNAKVRSQPRPYGVTNPVAVAKADNDEIDFVGLANLSESERSISVSGLDLLPQADSPQISFVGVVPAGEESNTPASFIDPSVFQRIAPEEAKAPEVDNASLDSFLKKIR